MLFIVPDADERPAAPGNGPAEPGKAPSFKVELDLDDAPFLEEPLEEKKAAAPEPETAPVPVKAEEKPKKANKFKILLERLKAKKKKLILAGGAACILLVAGIAANTLLFSEKAPPPEETGPKRVTIKTEPEPETPPEPVYLVTWDPFLVERHGSEGELRFLYCQFSTPTKDPVLQAEILAKRIVLRDAIYYYLRNKPLTFLTDASKQTALKEDLISVINEHVSSAKISELYFEEYVVRGS